MQSGALQLPGALHDLLALGILRGLPRGSGQDGDDHLKSAQGSELIEFRVEAAEEMRRVNSYSCCDCDAMRAANL